MIRLFCSLLLALLCVSAHASFSASVDRARLTEGESVELTLESDDPTLFGKPDLSPLDALFEVLGTRQVNRLATQNGRAQATTRWIVTLLPKQSGYVAIPPISLGASSTQPIRLHVLEARDRAKSSKLAPVFIDASVDQETVYVQAQAILTLRIYHSVSLYDDSSLTPLAMNDAKVEQLGEARPYEKEINGIRHGVIEVRYAIFPQKSGTLEIPAQAFSATLVDRGSDDYNPFGPRPGRQMRVTSPSIPLQVRPKPADYPADAPWMPARALSISESWSPQPEQAQVGESLTRNVLLKVEGLSGTQLPPLPLPDVQGLRRYPDQPQLADQSTDQGLIGSREEREALVPEQAGRIELPALEVVWWNTREDRLERTSLPPRTLEVAAAPQAEAEPPAAELDREQAIQFMQMLRDEGDPRSPPLGGLQPRQGATAQELADPKQYQAFEERQTRELVQAYTSGVQQIPEIRARIEAAEQGGERSAEEIDEARAALGQLEMMRDKLQRESPQLLPGDSAPTSPAAP